MAVSRGSWAAVGLTLRSLLWTILFPGVVAGYVPWRFFGVAQSPLEWPSPLTWLGLACTAVGAALLGACIVEFARRGRGTLSPVDPPRRLVMSGLYRFVRNPMYLGVTAILLGQVLITRSASLAIYWAVWFAVVNLFVMAYEEPALRRQFGAEYDDYARRVGRWVPALRPR
jgi:protein-S-isoprenylcysteine O-methyltransferase Ste14